MNGVAGAGAATVPRTSACSPAGSPPGVRIGNHVMREHGAQPWRFGASDYEAAVEGASSLGQALTGKAARAFWDEGLMTAMQQHELSIAEEALAASLLEDLKPA